MLDQIPILKQYVYGMLSYSLLIYKWGLIVFLLSSFFVRDRGAGWYVFLSELYDPILNRLRTWTRNRLVIEQFDLTPLVLFLILALVERLLAMLFLY